MYIFDIVVDLVIDLDAIDLDVDFTCIVILEKKITNEN